MFNFSTLYKTLICMADNYKQISSETLTKTRQKLEKPKLYKVILLNDDYTPMEYVVKLIKMVLVEMKGML